MNKTEKRVTINEENKEESNGVAYLSQIILLTQWSETTCLRWVKLISWADIRDSQVISWLNFRLYSHEKFQLKILLFSAKILCCASQTILIFSRFK